MIRNLKNNQNYKIQLYNIKLFTIIANYESYPIDPNIE